MAGAGTVRSAQDARAAAEAGARFAVSPGFTVAVGRACRDLGLPLLPGVATGSEIMAASEDGYTELKFFPAMQAGGPAMLKAWSGPFIDVRFWRSPCAPFCGALADSLSRAFPLMRSRLLAREVQSLREKNRELEQKPFGPGALVLLRLIDEGQLPQNLAAEVVAQAVQHVAREGPATRDQLGRQLEQQQLAQALALEEAKATSSAGL